METLPTSSPQPKEVVSAGAILRLEQYLLSLPQADIHTFHSFLPGVYERKIVIPPWTVLTGALHLVDCTIRLEAGFVAVTIADEVKKLYALHEFHAPAGSKRAIMTFEDPAIWVNVYDNPDDCTDIITLENRLYEEGSEALGENRNKLGNDLAPKLVGVETWLDG